MGAIFLAGWIVLARFVLDLLVLQVRDFFVMDGVPEAHDVLLRKGLLHQWTPGMSVIFVSHQWLGSVHPDPDGRHAAVLQGALQGVLNGFLAHSVNVSKG